MIIADSRFLRTLGRSLRLRMQVLLQKLEVALDRRQRDADGITKELEWMTLRRAERAASFRADGPGSDSGDCADAG